MIVNQNSIKTLIGYSSMFNINILLEFIFIKKKKVLPFKENLTKDIRENYVSKRLIVLTKSDGLIMGSRTREVSRVASSVPIVEPTEQPACTNPVICRKRIEEQVIKINRVSFKVKQI